MEKTESLFNQKVLWACENFINKYDLNIEIESREKPASVILNELLVKFAKVKKGERIFVIIDEYDHFTNLMLEGDISRFKKVANKGGFVRVFYEAIKDASEGNNAVIERFFATGVAPLTLDSLTSGFNIADNLSLNPKFVAMCGLTEKEVKDLVEKCGLDENVYEDLKKNYDGYRFSKKNEEHIFNSTLLMYYLRGYLEDLETPENIIDQNLATSLNKIKSLVNLETPKENYEKLVELLTTGEVIGKLIERFDLENEGYDVNSFLSLLFYQGYITIKEVIASIVKFEVPNYVSEVLYADYFSKLVNSKEKYKLETSEIENALNSFILYGKIDEMTKVVSNFLTYQSVRDRENFNEKTLKYIYSLFFSLNSQYYVYGEFPALQGFADLFIEKAKSSTAIYEAVIELKYLNKENAKKANMKKIKEEAISQMKGYIVDKRLAGRENLKKFVIIFEGFDKYNIYEIDELEVK